MTISLILPLLNRMRKSWPLVRSFLVAQDWNISPDSKTKWVNRMDEAQKSHVTLFPNEEKIELGLHAHTDGIPYCAWKMIKISSFESFATFCRRL